MFALIRWVEEPPKLDVVSVKQILRVNGQDVRGRSLKSGDKVEIRFQGKMCAAILKELGERQVLFRSLERLERELESTSSSQSETDYDEEEVHGRGKRKRIPNKRLASPEQAQALQPASQPTSTVAKRQLKKSEKERSRHVLDHLPKECSTCDPNLVESTRKALDDLKEATKDVRSLAAELRLTLRELRSGHKGPRNAVGGFVPETPETQSQSEDNGERDQRAREIRDTAPLFDTQECPRQPEAEVMIQIGEGLRMSRATLKSINWASKDKGKTVRQFLMEVFGHEVLAKSSLSGTVPNCHLQSGVVAKAQLDPRKVTAITSFCSSKLKLQDGEIRKMITYKCNDEAKKARKQSRRE